MGSEYRKLQSCFTANFHDSQSVDVPVIYLNVFFKITKEKRFVY